VAGNLSDLSSAGLTNTVDPSDVDNGVAVQWDDFFASGLPPSGSVTYNTAWRFSQFAVPPPPPPPVDNSVDAQLARLPAPRLGRAVNVGEVKGEVYVKLPGTSSAKTSQAKGRGFVRLSQARQIPVGSLLDTRGGTVRLVSSAGGNRRQQGDFNGGFFTAIQSRRGRGLTELRMARGKFTGCTTRSRRGKRAQTSRRTKRRIRRLRGNARGRFRTRGKYSSATVRGTDWTVTDRCDGTLTKVRRGSVVVRSLRRKKKPVIVRAGRSRLVRAPGG
jgi:hypothetical protein